MRAVPLGAFPGSSARQWRRETRKAGAGAKWALKGCCRCEPLGLDSAGTLWGTVQNTAQAAPREARRQRYCLRVIPGESLPVLLLCLMHMLSTSPGQRLPSDREKNPLGVCQAIAFTGLGSSPGDMGGAWTASAQARSTTASSVFLVTLRSYCLHFADKKTKAGTDGVCTGVAGLRLTFQAV